MVRGFGFLHEGCGSRREERILTVAEVVKKSFEWDSAG
jgi:hypothetical protein